MVRTILNLLFYVVLFLLVVILIYIGSLLYRAYTSDEQSVYQLLDPRFYTEKIRFGEEKWDTYESRSFSFSYPDSWDPKDISKQSDSNELIDFRIPVIFTLTKLGSVTVIGFSKTQIGQFRPAGIVSESDLIMYERRGYKWVSKKDRGFVYTYAVPLNTNEVVYGQRQTFYISVESTQEDKKLEQTLDRIAQSVKVIKPE